MKQDTRCFVGVTALFAALVVVLAGVSMMVLPVTADLSPGFITPIIAFEFARSDSDLGFMTGAAHSAQIIRQQMYSGLQWDVFFPLAYSGLMALSLWQLLPRWKLAALLLAVAVIGCDWWENKYLLDILQALDVGNSPVSILPLLWQATWLKWGGIAFMALLIALGSWKNGQPAMAVLGAVCFGVSVIAFAWSSVALLLELMAVTVVILLLGLVGRAGINGYQLWSAERLQASI